MRTAAILPVKRLAEAKQRLGASMADPVRLELARAMIADVLYALAQTASIERTIVVTCESSLAAAAREQGALVLEDAPEAGQSAAVRIGVRRALAEGIERVLCIPGDCPALDPAELDRLLLAGHDDRDDRDARDGSAVGRAREVVIIPDRHGTGTNGLLLAPPDAIEPSFGPDSFARHRALALAAGAACRVERPPSLLLDIDTGADLVALRERLAGAGASAPRTRAVLSQPERPDMLSITSTG
ncbi:MAG: 2-phospho-L-lactate guanylyltransferase [Solirubrobacterales bacterium]